MINNKTVFTDLAGKHAVITGGYGVIGLALARALAAQGVTMLILGRDGDKASAAAEALHREFGVKALGSACDVTDAAALKECVDLVNRQFDCIDLLINCAGGNDPSATTRVEQVKAPYSAEAGGSFFDLDPVSFDRVFNLNCTGTLLPCQVFGQVMAERGSGAILNISSMNSFRPLTRIPAYSAAKAAVNNLTQWMAVHLAGTGIRVNAIAPGFFLTDQNRFLLIDPDNEQLTPRGRKIIDATPMKRFGDPEEICGAALFLLSNAARFITGTVLPVDGGFNAYSGV
jgi:NAD(P)-dependent dehydrogenase (short-subunit alcohol dehydrogenase family)